tara:strand:- start:788 stop:1060 length:273 start_codon:yes stop_codon:yes gene_type:complete
MNYVEYPFQNPDFFKKSIEVETEFIGPKQKNCLTSDKYKSSCNEDVIFGNEKPIGEECTKLEGTLSFGPDTSCSSVWNNMTKRKSLVKDY